MSWHGDIEDWAGERAIPLINAIARKSAERLAEQANTSRFQPGGNTPVDTGFLINSIGANAGSMPYGPDTPVDGESYQQEPNMNQLNLTITAWQPLSGVNMFIGWSANYAERMEAVYAFARKAAQNWPQTVDATASEYRERLNAN